METKKEKLIKASAALLSAVSDLGSDNECGAMASPIIMALSLNYGLDITNEALNIAISEELIVFCDCARAIPCPYCSGDDHVTMAIHGVKLTSKGDEQANSINQAIKN